MSDAVFKGDNTGAFGNNFITIYLDNPDGYEISKVIFVCGTIQKAFNNPIFPLTINLSEAETAKLRVSNVCYLVAYDAYNRQRTCQGTLTFNAQNGVINNGICW